MKQTTITITTRDTPTTFDVEDRIAQEYFFKAHSGALTSYGLDNDADYDTLDRVTFCVLVLDNDFILTGEAICDTNSDLDYETRCQIAKDEAVEKARVHLLFMQHQERHETRQTAQVLEEAAAVMRQEAEAL